MGIGDLMVGVADRMVGLMGEECDDLVFQESSSPAGYGLG